MKLSLFDSSRDSASNACNPIKFAFVVREIWAKRAQNLKVRLSRDLEALERFYCSTNQTSYQKMVKKEFVAVDLTNSRMCFLAG